MSRTKKVNQPKLPNTVKISHLSVHTDINGKVTLEWDWKQLQKDVVSAVKAFEKVQKEKAKLLKPKKPKKKKDKEVVA